MTSQIAISNQTGIVIASDTVTTLTTEDTFQKSISDQQKIWPLEPNNLIAIVTSGITTINGIRKSTLITEWKRSLGKTFETVQEAAEHFNFWLSEKNQPFTEDSERKVILDLVRYHISDLRQVIVESLKEANLYFSDSEAADEVTSIIDKSIVESVEVLKNLPSYTNFDLKASKKSIKESAAEIDLIIDDIMWDCNPDIVLRNTIHESLPLLLSTVQDIDDLDAEFGFVGFGSKEIVSSICRVSVRGYYCSSLQSSCINDGEYDIAGSGEIALFAQTDAIRAFTSGYHEDVLKYLSDFAIEKISGYIDDVDSLFEIAVDLEDSIRDYGHENFAVPLLATIGTLNLNDLAKLADSLIGMQSIKSAASPRPATVGGLIEILLVDREHGFRWYRKLPSRTSSIPLLG
jgi:hypothetical protein